MEMFTGLMGERRMGLEIDVSMRDVVNITTEVLTLDANGNWFVLKHAQYRYFSTRQLIVPDFHMLIRWVIIKLFANFLD